MQEVKLPHATLTSRAAGLTLDWSPLPVQVLAIATGMATAYGPRAWVPATLTHGGIQIEFLAPSSWHWLV